MKADDSTRLSILRAAEKLCLREGVDRLSVAAVASALDESPSNVSKYFHDELAILDAILERHQTPYERTWEDVLPTLTAARDVIRLLAATITRQVYDEDGGPAYVVIAAQMCTSSRFALTGRPATTSPAALLLMGKLMAASKVSFEVLPIHFERFAVTLFSSVASWYRHGAARIDEALFVEDLVDTLEFLSIGEISRPLGASSSTSRET